MPAGGRASGLSCRRRVRADGVGPGGDDDRIAFARILVVFEPGGNILATINHKLRRGLLELVVDAGAILFRLAVEQRAGSFEAGEIGKLVKRDPAALILTMP